MDVGMKKLRHVAKPWAFDRFWPDTDTSKWPGRELFWIWCHPVLTFLILCGVVAEITLAIVNGLP